MVVGGYGGLTEDYLDLVELVPLDYLTNTAPTCLSSLNKFPTSMNAHMSGTVGSGKVQEMLNL
jgi:hypothetical protein